MKHLAKILLAALALVLAFAMLGCGDGGSLGQYGLGTPGGPGQPGDDGGSIALTGRVTDGEGVGIEGVTVMTTNGTTIWSVPTDEDGNYALPDVPSNDYMLGFYRYGYGTEYVRPTVTGNTATGNAVLTSTSNLPAEKPVFTVDTPITVSENGTAEISGTIANLDAGQAIISVNGFQSTITVGSGGSFEALAVLQPGNNIIYLWVDNGLGTTIYGPINLTYTPSGNVFFRVTLSWDGPGDIDLHTWDPNLYHSAWWNEMIPTGTLDVDNTDADGPENFTCTTLEQGRFHVAINSFELYNSTPRNATVKVSVFTGPNAGKTYTFGPNRFTTEDSETYPVQPPSWWQPCDVLVNGDVISAVAPDGTQLPEDDPGATLTRAKAKK